MSTAIPEILWLQEYEQRLEFLARNERERAWAGSPSTFLALR